MRLSVTRLGRETASIITTLKNLHDRARNLKPIGNSLPQLDDGQVGTTGRRRHFVRVVVDELHYDRHRPHTST